MILCIQLLVKYLQGSETGDKFLGVFEHVTSDRIHPEALKSWFMLNQFSTVRIQSMLLYGKCILNHTIYRAQYVFLTFLHQGSKIQEDIVIQLSSFTEHYRIQKPTHLNPQ